MFGVVVVLRVGAKEHKSTSECDSRCNGKDDESRGVYGYVGNGVLENDYWQEHANTHVYMHAFIHTWRLTWADPRRCA